MEKNFKLIYSETARRQVRSLHPDLEPQIKTKIEKISEHPYIGKFLEKDLSGYLSLRAKRYRIIYRVNDNARVIEIHHVGYRKDIYQLFSEQIQRR